MHPVIALCAAALLAGCAAAPRQAPNTLHYENERIEKTLAQHGVRFEHVVRGTVYTTHFEALKKSEQTRKGFHGTHTPAATWVEIKRLYVPHALLEIEVTARIPAS